MDARLGEDEAQPLVLDVVETDRLAANDTSSRIPDGLLFGREVQDRLGGLFIKDLADAQGVVRVAVERKVLLGREFGDVRLGEGRDIRVEF